MTVCFEPNDSQSYSSLVSGNEAKECEAYFQALK